MKKIILLLTIGSLVFNGGLRSVLAQPKEEDTPLLLMVTGRVILEDDYIFLESEAGKNYLLVGALAQELKELEGEKITVRGKIKLPEEEELGRRKIRFIIDVENIINED